MTFGLMPGFSGNVLVILFITIFLELIIYFLWFRKGLAEVFKWVVLINLFTVPLANFVYGEFFNYHELGFIVIELGVVLVEAYLIKELFSIKLWKAGILSLVANLVSAIVGIFLLFWLLSL